MSDKDRQKKDGRNKDKKNQAARQADNGRACADRIRTERHHGGAGEPGSGSAR